MASPTESTTAKWLRRALYFSATAFAACILVLISCIAFSLRPPGEWFGYVSSASLFATLVCGIGRFAYVLFAELQAPLNELLITFLVAGGLLTILRTLLKDTIDANETAQWVAFMLVVCAGVMLGSIWGWSLIKRLGERDARRRLRLLGLGWIGIFGVSGAAVFAFLTAFWIATSISSASVSFGYEFSTIYLGHLAAIPLAIPALMVERRIRKSAALSAAQIQIEVKPALATSEAVPLSHPVSATSTPPGTPSI